MIQNRKLHLTLLTILPLLAFISVVITNTKTVHADTSIVITSPAQNQKFTGNSFTISGTTDANATVLIQKDGTVLKQTKANGAGVWSAELADLPDGENTITARVVKNSGYAYLTTTPDLATGRINQIRLSDNAINPNVGWPITSPDVLVAVIPSPVDEIFYSFSSAFAPSVVPKKFDAGNPGTPVPVNGDYPANAGGNTGAFTSDGSKYYSPNLLTGNTSVIDVATNAWVKNINTGGTVPTLIMGSNGLLYGVRVSGGTVITIEPETDAVSEALANPCDNEAPIGAYFSTDVTHEYYYLPCPGDGVIKKVKISDNSVVGDYDVGGTPMILILSADSSRIYILASVAEPGTVDTDKVRVLDTLSGEIIASVQLEGGVIGALASPDFQKLYLPTPGADFSGQNLDIVDMTDFSVDHIPLTGEIPVVVTASPASTADIADVNVGVVLGVNDAASPGAGENEGEGGAGELARTGAAVGLSAVVSMSIIALAVYTSIDFSQHRRPLVEEDPESAKIYTYAHHLRYVTLPVLQHRMQDKLRK